VALLPFFADPKKRCVVVSETLDPTLLSKVLNVVGFIVFNPKKIKTKNKTKTTKQTKTNEQTNKQK